MILSVNTIEHSTTLSTRQCLLVRKKNETNTNSAGKDVEQGHEARQGMKEKRDGQEMASCKLSVQPWGAGRPLRLPASRKWEPFQIISCIIAQLL